MMMHPGRAQAYNPPTGPDQAFDRTGKVVLSSVYDSPDPRAYWRTLAALDYRVPEEAKPYFLRALMERRAQSWSGGPCKVVDLGCSYGVNGALLRFNLSVADIHRRYATEHAAALDRATLLRRDRALEARRNLEGVRFVGIDVSPNAATYALEAGFVDDILVANLEGRALSPNERALVTDADLVFSTGCIGYVTVETLERILDASDERAPWMVHTALRMFDLGVIERVLARRGYMMARNPRLVRQRRFASRREQEQILDTLSCRGLDCSALEAEGWLYAYIVLALPRSEANSAVARRILD
jgi:predicted TPR repeat methyltransferase